MKRKKRSGTLPAPLGRQQQKLVTRAVNEARQNPDEEGGVGDGANV